jgi:PAS domain S-box-containing protein
MNASCYHSDSCDESAAAESPDARTLRHDGERFRLLVENSLDIIVEISREHRVLYVSPNVTAILGYAVEELVGTRVLAKVHPDDLAEVLTQLERAAGRATCRCQHKDGSWTWFETTGREFVAQEGAPHRVLVARDITERIQAAAERDRLETELARAERLTALGTIAGGMAHDFNNLLTAIMAHSSLARIQTTEAHVRESLEQILKAADRAKNLTQQVLDFSSQQKRARTPVKLAAVVREVLKLMRLTIPDGVEVYADLTDESGTVFADATQLHQVLVNLCQNAVHALPEGRGRLVVRVEAIEVDGALAKKEPGLRGGPAICLTVADNGHGMDAATQRRIFEPFFTTKPVHRGTGLGLAVVQRIVRDHHGVIHVTSQPGEGAAFRIFFPSYRDPVAVAP